VKIIPVSLLVAWDLDGRERGCRVVTSPGGVATIRDFPAAAKLLPVGDRARRQVIAAPLCVRWPAMLGLRGLIFITLGGFGALFTGAWGRQLARLRTRPPEAADAAEPATAPGWPSPVQLGIGLVTNFFDYFGIGSFAPTTALFRFLRLVPDRLIPGTLLIGHTPPTLAEAFISIAIIKVDLTTLVPVIAAHMLGSWLGAGVVSRLPRRKIQLVMGGALLVAAALMAAKTSQLLPAGGDALGLAGGRLVVGLCGSFVIGALMTVGIGNFAPSLVLFGLLGMNTKAIYPLMMGSCAFLMTVGSLQFLKRASYAPRSALGLGLAGPLGVLLAAYLHREMPIRVLSWLVVVVVVYTAASLLRTALRNDQAAAPPEAA
jgi:uncharacterized membrane protein YfcA